MLSEQLGQRGAAGQAPRPVVKARLIAHQFSPGASSTGPNSQVGHAPVRSWCASAHPRICLTPAKDRSASPEDSRAAFYMTNIVPQSPASNQKAWERLEDYCRRLANEGYVLSIACGPAGVGGTGKDGRKDVIGKSHKVTVPAKLWKVILVLPRADAEPRKNTRVIAVIMPNDQSVNFDWAKYRTSTRQVEKLTGLHFFSAVTDPEVAEALRDHVDEVKVPQPRSRRSKKNRSR